jgi:hypothetical protein
MAFVLDRSKKRAGIDYVTWTSRGFVACAFIFAAVLYFWIWRDVIGATLFIGGIGIVLLFLIYFLLFFEALEAVNPSPEIIALAVAFILYVMFYGPPVPEFVNTAFAPSAKLDPPPSATAEIKRTASKREIPALADGFRNWLDERIPREKRLASNRKYPVFIVAAQGGGQYAAYHAALSLARLYDSCPKLKDHVFAISGVSGGSVGAAVFSQLLRSQPALADTCSDDVASVKTQENPARTLEDAVNRFFEFDLVTPVIATGLLFDLPALVSPFPRFMPDRARTLELAIDNALEYAIGPSARSKEFYSSWAPKGIAPALFLNTTTANYGRPILLSQLYMADERTDTAYAQILKSAIEKFGAAAGDGPSGKADKKMLARSVRASEYSRPAYFNILQYRSDIQLSLATAAVLSARFPFVTPPGVLYRAANAAAEKEAIDDDVAIETTLNETKALQLIDGGFSDNSGIATANEIVRQLKAADAKKEYAARVEFHLISFGHSNAALQLQGERDASPEFIAPFSTFEAVREARSLGEADAKTAGFDVVHGYHLFDREFQAPLSWTLSEAMRSAIDRRSGGSKVPPFVCCSPALPEFGDDAYPEIILDVQKLKEVHERDFPSFRERIGLKEVAPNVRQFQSIIRAVRANSESANASQK